MRSSGCLASDAPWHSFDGRVLEQYVVVEVSVHRDVDVLRDRGGDQKAVAGLSVVRRQVGAAAAERDAQRGTGDDHERCASSMSDSVAMASSIEAPTASRPSTAASTSTNSWCQDRSVGGNSQVVAGGGPIDGLHLVERHAFGAVASAEAVDLDLRSFEHDLEGEDVLPFGPRRVEPREAA